MLDSGKSLEILEIQMTWLLLYKQGPLGIERALGRELLETGLHRRETRDQTWGSTFRVEMED